MLRNKMKIIRSFILAIIVLFFGANVYLLFINHAWLQSYLSITKPVGSEVLIVEGWMDYSLLSEIADTYYSDETKMIITTGIEFTKAEYYTMYTTGFYCIDFTEDSGDRVISGDLTIEIAAKGTVCKGQYPEFDVYINTSRIGAFKVSSELDNYHCKWNGNLHDLDSLLIHYKNDCIHKDEDRNLQIKSVKINGQPLSSFSYLSYFDQGLLDGNKRRPIITDARNYSEAAKAGLISCGIPENKIIAIPALDVSKFRTYHSALKVKKWIEKNNTPLLNFNVLTQGIHARRTWISYREVFNTREVNIGIVSLESSHPQNERQMVKNLFAEFYSCIVYKIYFLFK